MNNTVLAHELSYRSEGALQKIEDCDIFICGVGAIGSNLVDNLLRQGFSNVAVIDDDIVEEHNIGTQAYCVYDLGISKVKALSRKMFRDLKCQITTYQKRLKGANIEILNQFNLVVDAFDNKESRALVAEYCDAQNIPCVHAGMSGDGYFQVVWNDNYIVPTEDGVGIDVCEYPLARNLVSLTVATLSEVIVKYVVLGKKMSIECTLGDLSFFVQE